MKLHLLPTILTAVFGSASAAKDSQYDPIQNFPALVEWFTSHGGQIDPRITLGYEPSTNPKVRIRGMIATAHIEPETVLIHTPASLMISDFDRNHCEVIQRVVEELELGEESKWDIYFKFDGSSLVSASGLDDGEEEEQGHGQRHTRTPTQWKTEDQPGSRAILELQGLPPTGDTHRHINWYTSACNDSEELTSIQLKAFVMFLTRAADRGMVPMYDLMNHHNGLINTRLQSWWGESTVDVFNTYGFVEDYPQLWRWSDVDMIVKAEDPNHAFGRYVGPDENSGVDAEGRGFEPNSHHYEILVISPTLAALHPTKALVHILGNGRRTIDEWKVEINNHHATLRKSHVNAMHDSALAVLSELPTTIKEDENTILPNERRLFEKVKKKGRVDQSKADTIQAIEYRLAFKKALKLAVDVARSGQFYLDSDEL
ncbi:hypothetical protein QTG54_006308 [Skeletonema marinoi]|uniref:SET domain-containing protein n=1 Tax=Skeletonema marinoi TaxID=267567 RepID=A0AAD8YCD2_9STRA|nr:hypothetical protein QTG54_006308 [Skeletonema marinoi]